MSRRANESTTVQLFPFLAVLVCTMGSLIFLLLVTTRQIRNRQVAYAAFQLQQQQLASGKDIPTPTPEESDDSSTQIPIPASPSAIVEEVPNEGDKAYELAVAERERQQEELVAEWKRKTRELKRLRDQRRHSLSNRKSVVDAAVTRANGVKADVEQLELKLGQLAGEAAATTMTAAAEADQMVIEQKIAEMKKRLKAAQAAEANSENDKFQVIPFDAASGTTRRPILIECTAEGIRFLPEGVTITATDLEGFTQRANPLAAGTAALIGYWTDWNSKQKNPRSQPEPYPLLLVRPDGEVAYYVAMRMLEPIRMARGYELIEADTALALPEVDPGAKMALDVAVKQLLAERENIYRAATQSRSGDAVFGRPGRRGGGGGGGAGFGSGSGTGSGVGESSGGGNGNPGVRTAHSPGFTMNDIAPANEEIGSNSWERIENFQGRRKSASGGLVAKDSAEGQRTGATGQVHNAQAGASRLSGTTTADADEDASSPSTTPSNIRSVKNVRKRGLASGTDSTSDSSSRDSDAHTSDSESTWEDYQTSSTETESASSIDQARPHNPGRGDQPSRDESYRGRRESPISNSPGSKHRRSPSDREKQLEPEMLAGRHWGQSEAGASIGFEHDVRVDVFEDKIIIAEKYEVRVEDGQSRQELFESFVGAIDRYTQEWGRAPQGFFWTPRLKFYVKPEASSVYERTNSLMTRSGLSTSHEFTDSATTEPKKAKASTAKKNASKPRSGGAK